MPRPGPQALPGLGPHERRRRSPRGPPPILRLSPTTPEADKILHANKVFVIPDILANSGGVIVSYLEWVQNLERIGWTETEVNDMLKKKITGAFGDVHAASLKHGTDMRTAAMIVAVGRVADAVRTLGIFP
ncbi:MAG: hypothetical protein JRN50_03115 [Nitrososphaerota archaeon]|nr:hypothetical protein [Nitrososphaerota archaeon]